MIERPINSILATLAVSRRTRRSTGPRTRVRSPRPVNVAVRQMGQPSLIRAWMLALGMTPATVALTFLVAMLAAEAQQIGRPPRIGILYLGSQSTQGVFAEVAREELRRLGYVDRETVILEIRFANGRLDRVRGLATELVGAHVDIILTSGTSVVQEIRPVAGNTPIVASMVDPVSAGFAESFAHPGGNITGVAFELADLTAKRLQLLKEIIHGVSRVAFLYYSDLIPDALRKVAADTLQPTAGAAAA